MSLDVSLIVAEPVAKVGTGVFIRENGGNRELSIEEVRDRYKDKGDNICEKEYETNVVYDANITHNLNTMADAAGIYKALWRPEEINVTKASQLIKPLTEGLCKLISDPEKYKAFNPSNGWGSYDVLVKFVQKYLAACCKYPDAMVQVCR